MNIALITDYYLPTLGGVQTVVKAQKEELERAGHTVTVFCPLHEPSTDPTVVCLPTSRLFKPDGYPFTWPPKRVTAVLECEFTARDIHIVHIHTEMIAAVCAITAARRLRIPIIQTMHGRLDVYTQKVLPLPFLSSWILARLHMTYLPHGKRVRNVSDRTKTVTARRMWRLMVAQANAADHVIVPSGHFATKLVDMGVTVPVSVISNGVETSVTDELGTAKTRRRDAGTPLSLMWCGRISPEKRPDTFVEAMRLLPVDVTADMYGNGVAMAAVRKLLATHGLHDRVTLHGSVPQSEVLEAMRTHHLFVSSSYDFDNQPMVLLEAIATGLPVVYCDPDLGEMLPQDGSIVTEAPTPDALATTIRSFRDNPARVAEMSTAMIASKNTVRQDAHLTAITAIYTRYAV